MLIAYTESGNVVATWGIEEANFRLLYLDLLRISCVLADSEELAFIDNYFHHLPGLRNSSSEQPASVSWFGDHARFIVANLPFIELAIPNSGGGLLQVEIPALRDLREEISVRLYNLFIARFGKQAMGEGSISLHEVAKVSTQTWRETRGMGVDSLTELRCLLKRFYLTSPN
jgi:hypothetical protein